MILLISLAMLLCTVSPVFAAGETGDALTVGVPNDRCPIFYQDADTGEAVGIGVDLMRIAAEDAGYSVSFVFVEEETLKERLRMKGDKKTVAPYSQRESTEGRQ